MDNEQQLNESMNALSNSLNDMRFQTWNPYQQYQTGNNMTETNGKLDKIIYLLEQINYKISEENNEHV